MSQEQKDWRQAVAELKELHLQRVEGLEATTSEYKEKFDKINETLDNIDMEVKKIEKPAPSPETVKSQVVDEFKDVVMEFAKGEGARKALQNREVKSQYHPMLQKASENLVRFDLASAGALLLPNAISTDIIKDVTEVTPVMGLARVTPTQRSAYERRVRTSTPGGRWLAEEIANEKGKPTYAIIKITPHKWAAQYGMSIEQEQDSGYNLVSELMEAYREDYSVDLGGAFLSGNGVGKPFGMIGRVENIDTSNVILSSDDLIFAQESLKEEYQNRGSWLFNRDTRATVRALVLGEDNALQYLWEPDFTRRSPTMLLGSPVNIARQEDLASPTDKKTHTYTAGAVFALYGDFRSGYEIVPHTDMYLIDDVYSDASTFVRNLHIMSRIGGNVIKKEAITTITAKPE